MVVEETLLQLQETNNSRPTALVPQTWYSAYAEDGITVESTDILGNGGSIGTEDIGCMENAGSFSRRGGGM